MLSNLPPSFEDGEIHEAFKEVHQVKREDLRPINDPHCDHVMVPDPEEDTEFFFGIVCEKCGRGKLIRKPLQA